MNQLNPEMKKAVDAKTEPCNHNNKNKTGVLIVEDHRGMRRELCRLINRESDFAVCAEAENTSRLLNTVETKTVDFAVVDISPYSAAAMPLVEEIRMLFPNLPLLILSINDQSLYDKYKPGLNPDKYVITASAAKQIKKAVYYVRSLIQSQIFGFTVLVKIKKSIAVHNGV